jgi:hypothetical protein
MRVYPLFPVLLFVVFVVSGAHGLLRALPLPFAHEQKSNTVFQCW